MILSAANRLESLFAEAMGANPNSIIVLLGMLTQG
jgi:hypothetical protein